MKIRTLGALVFVGSMSLGCATRQSEFDELKHLIQKTEQLIQGLEELEKKFDKPKKDFKNKQYIDSPGNRLNYLINATG